MESSFLVNRIVASLERARVDVDESRLKIGRLVTRHKVFGTVSTGA